MKAAKSASSSSRQDRFQALDDFRRKVPHVSQSALHKILDEAVAGIPEGSHHRCTIREARNFLVNKQTPYGPLLKTLQLQCKDGAMQTAAFIDPFAHMCTAALQCEGYAALMKRTLRNKPNSPDNPWNLVLYSDEVAPGNQMSHHNMRKSWAVYMALLEFGMAVLSDEDAWTCVAAERSDRLAKVDGGIGQFFTALLKFLFATHGHSFHNSGVKLQFADGTEVRLFVNLKMVIQDGAAHKFVFFLKGDAGTRFCIECRTLVADRSGKQSLHDDAAPEDLLHCNLVLKKDMDLATDDDVRGTVRRLALVPPAELKLREQACGVVHNQHNMLLEPSLDAVVRPITHKAHDWMHALMVHGVWNTCLYLVLFAVVTAGHTDAVSTLHDFVLRWILPGRIRTNMGTLAECFTRTRWTAAKKATYIKCMASEALSLYSIVCYYLVTVYRRAGECVQEIDNYVHLCDLIDQILSIPLGGVTGADLDAVVDRFLRGALAAHWHEFIGPKWHWLVHLGDQLVRFEGVLLSCFVHERKHRIVKRFQDGHRNTLSMEEGVLADATLQHLYEMRDPMKFDRSERLMPPIADCKQKAADRIRRIVPTLQGPITTSRRARVTEHEVCHVRDVVLFWDGNHLVFGQIWFLFCCDHNTLALIALWPTLSEETQSGSATVRMDDTAATAPIGDVVTAVAYKPRDDGNANVLVPCKYRTRLYI